MLKNRLFSPTLHVPPSLKTSCESQKDIGVVLFSFIYYCNKLQFTVRSSINGVFFPHKNLTHKNFSAWFILTGAKILGRIRFFLVVISAVTRIMGRKYFAVIGTIPLGCGNGEGLRFVIQELFLRLVRNANLVSFGSLCRTRESHCLQNWDIDFYANTQY